MSIPVTLLNTLSEPFRQALLADDTMKITFSQFGEDVTIFNTLMNKVHKIQGGFYVDIGAFHPRRYSNTKILNLLGWRGLNIDASEDSIALFAQERPDDINVCCGVAETEGFLDYHRFASGAPSTFSADFAQHYHAQGGAKHVETKRLRVRPIADILEEFMPPGQTIDYMNIDVEGFDRIVVAGIDFNRYRPAVLTVEMHDVDKLHMGDDPTFRHLMSNGYDFIALNLITYAFLDRRFATGAG